MNHFCFPEDIVVFFEVAKIHFSFDTPDKLLYNSTANAYYFFHPLSFIAMFVYCHCMQAAGLQGMVAQGQVRSTATLGE